MKKEELCPYSFRSCNPANIRITNKDVDKIFRKFNIKDSKGNIATVRNIDNYLQAFVHESYVEATPSQSEKEPEITDDEFKEYGDEYPKCIPLQEHSYDRLEFRGDRVLDQVVVDYICERYPEISEGSAEGYWTELKTKLVRTERLCILAKKLKLQKFVLVSRKQEEYRYNDDVLEDVFEAFLGAIFVDFGRHAEAYGICCDFITRLMERYLNFSQIVRCQDNYKKLLLEYYHEKFGAGKDPEYQNISHEGPTNERLWKRGVTNIDGFIIATGEGKTRTAADQIAAKEALKYYGVDDVYSDSEEPTKQIYSDSESEDLD